MALPSFQTITLVGTIRVQAGAPVITRIIEAFINIYQIIKISFKIHQNFIECEEFIFGKC
jgi:hypothetical protein